jgi:uncharacterized delta-60 repeat protein
MSVRCNAMRRVLCLITCGFTLSVWVVPAAAATVTLDPDFGSAGVTLTPAAGAPISTALAVVHQGRRYIVAGGGYNPEGSYFTLARYNHRGQLDESFAHAGFVHQSKIKGQHSSGGLTDVAVQADRKIVAVGSSSGPYGDDFAVARYNPDGSRDMSFGDRGGVTLGIGHGDDEAWGVAIQPNGKIILVGSSSAGGWTFTVCRYHPDGSLDLNFGHQGVMRTQIGERSFASSVALTSDRKIVVAGYGYNGFDNDVAIARYKSDGHLDKSFGTQGTALVGTANDDYASAVDVSSIDGYVIVAGQSGTNTNKQALLASFAPDGSPDLNFNGSGYRLANVGSSYASLGSIEMDEVSGKLNVAGAASNGSEVNFLVGRFTFQGGPDPDFGTNGLELLDLQPGQDAASDLVVDATESRMVVAGYAHYGSDLSGRQFALVACLLP